MNLYDNKDLRWKHYTGNDKFNYPIDFWSALLNARADGHVDLLYRWEPNSYCHFHRHSAHTTSVVLEGELHVIDVDAQTGEEKSVRVRTVGDYASKAPGDVHMERGGPEGALVLFSLYTPDGLLAETLADDGRVLSQSTMEPILAKIAR
jgi:hypothetical protein